MHNPKTTYLCDKCQKEVLFHELKVIAGQTVKFCKECYDNREPILTYTQEELLLWLYEQQVPDTFEGDHLTWLHIDQGNIINAYQEIIGEDQEFQIKAFLNDMQALTINKFIRTHTMDAFYAITPEGIAQVESKLNTFYIYQCCQCGEIYHPDYPESFDLETKITEKQKTETIEDTCQNCTDQNDRWANLWTDDDEQDPWEGVLVYGE